MAQGETTRPGRPIGVGIVGCGIIARTHIRALLAFPGEARVTALASRSPESIAGAAAYLREQAESHASEAEADGDAAQAASCTASTPPQLRRPMPTGRRSSTIRPWTP